MTDARVTVKCINRKWEYAFYLPRKGESPTELNWDGDRMNELGRDGWEAICVVGDGLPTVALLLKREILT